MNSVRITYIFFCLLPGFLFCTLQAQEVQVIDSNLKLPVPFASIRLIRLDDQSSTQLISDSSGYFLLPDTSKFLVTIQALSYKNYTGTISGKGIQKIYLEPSQFNIDRVVVTGRIKPQLADKSIYTVKVIDQGTIANNAANNLGDILSTTLGFQYRSEGILGDFIRIQGLTGEHIKILLDGVPIAGRSGGFIDLGQINLDNIDHMEIIEGPMAVIYGNNAMAVINLISKQPSQKYFYGNLGMFYETSGRYNFHANISKSFKNQSLGLYFARNFNSGWSPDKNQRFYYYKPKLQYVSSLEYEWKTSHFDLQVQSDYLFEELRDPDSVHISSVYDNMNDSSYLTYLATDYYYYTTRINNRLNYRRILNPDTWLGFQTAYSYYKKQKDCYNKDLVTLQQWPLQDYSYFDTSYYSSFISKLSAYTEKIRQTELQAGLEYSLEHAKSKRIRGSRQISDFAAYANLLYTASKQIQLQPGVRFIYNSSYKSPVVYSINTLYKPGKFQFRASISNSFRAPTVKELYFEFIDNNHHIMGNPELTSEKGFNITFNSKYSFFINNANITPELTLFRNTIENAIQLALDLNRPGWGYYINIPSTNYRTQGFRFQLNSVIFKTIRLNTGISSTGKSNLERKNNYNYSTDYSFELSVHHPKYKLQSNIQYKYTAPYFDYVGTFNENQQLNGILEQQFASYQIMNMVFIKRFKESKFVLSAGIKNIFDVSMIKTQGTINIHGGDENSTLAGYGRSYFFKINYTLEKHEK